MLGIWKREWYSSLFSLLTPILLAFIVMPYLPRPRTWELTAVVVCGMAIGWAAGWGAFALQEYLRKPTRPR